jgi:hypothetical protein
VLLIDKNTNNTIILTLNENQTLASPYYLMRCVSDYNKTEKAFILASDLSIYSNRYNQFTLTESASEVLTSGTVTLNPSGWWTYYVYEQTSSTNLNYRACNNTIPLEIGRMWVNYTPEEVKTYEQTTQYKGYGNGQS